MYRLTLYFLIALSLTGFFYSLIGILPFDPIQYVFSITLLLLTCYLTNRLFSSVFKAPTNIESFWISALILGLIIKPPTNLTETIFIFWAGVLAMSSKYILAVGKKHIFNPVAISVAITSLTINGSANWWVGTISMLPVVSIGALLIIRKIRRWDLVISFLITALLITGPNRILRSITDSPLVFFASIMITEPLTTPPTRMLRIIYGAIVGFLFSPQIHIGPIFSTPEISLIIGNVFSYLASPKYKLLLTLKERAQLTPDTFDFVFASDIPVKFKPGQYMEFTLDHRSPDARGVRRYLSIASAPTEEDIRLGVKVGNPPSSFKKNLLNLSVGQKIVAGQLIGDFTLPKDVNKKIVLIAGGIGITPYRSILKDLIDRNEKRDIVILYSASSSEEFVYKDILTEAERKLGIKTIFIDTSKEGHMDAGKLVNLIPDYLNRTFYISGSHGVVSSFENLLKSLRVQSSHVITDYFPGFV